MIFRTFASAIIVALNSYQVSATGAVLQEDATMTSSATQDLLSETMVEGETSTGGFFGRRTNEPLFNYMALSSHPNNLVRRGKEKWDRASK